jgi:signal transduction histidine kinase
MPFIEEIDQAAGRLAKISQQMLTYTASQYRRIEAVNLSAVIEGISPMLAGIATGRAWLDLRLAEELPRIQADVSLLQQAVTNLVTNAVEAARETGGLVSVETAVRRFTRDDLRRAVVGGDLPEGDYVSLEVSDTGSGMGPAVLRSMFDPFFTTRFTGRGLGLAAVHGISRMHHAALFAESTPGAGTTIRLLFQALDREPV